MDVLLSFNLISLAVYCTNICNTHPSMTGRGHDAGLLPKPNYGNNCWVHLLDGLILLYYMSELQIHVQVSRNSKVNDSSVANYIVLT